MRPRSPRPLSPCSIGTSSKQWRSSDGLAASAIALGALDWQSRPCIGMCSQTLGSSSRSRPVTAKSVLIKSQWDMEWPATYHVFGQIVVSLFDEILEAVDPVLEPWAGHLKECPRSRSIL